MQPGQDVPANVVPVYPSRCQLRMLLLLGSDKRGVVLWLPQLRIITDSEISMTRMPTSEGAFIGQASEMH